jgi:hypothetical protein
MKKYVIKIFLAFVVIAALVLILLGFLSIEEAKPSYRFLEGQNPVACKKPIERTGDGRRIKGICYIYSFEEDVKDLCSKADAELIPAGFDSIILSVGNLSGNDSPCRVYYLMERFPRGPIWVYIYDNIQCIKHTNSNNYGIAPRDGWVMVEVVYVRGWRWPF